MSFSNQLNDDFSSYGFVPEENNNEPLNNENEDYSSFGFVAENKTPLQTSISKQMEEKPKEDKFKKTKAYGYGLAEGALGLAGLATEGAQLFSNKLTDAVTGGQLNKILPRQKVENPFLSAMSSFPEPKDEEERRMRTGASGAITGAPYGIPGIIGGLIGSQAGQTIREVYGKNGKFESLAPEIGAITVDTLFGLGTGLATNLTKKLGKSAIRTANNLHAIFKPAQTGLQKAVVKNAIQVQKTALQNILNDFNTNQI